MMITSVLHSTCKEEMNHTSHSSKLKDQQIELTICFYMVVEMFLLKLLAGNIIVFKEISFF